MQNNLRRILEKYQLRTDIPSPLIIPDTTRYTLAALFGELDYKVGCEVGVGSGVYSEAICKAVPGVKLYAVDAYIPYPGYPDFLVPEPLEKDKQDAIEKLGRYDVEFIYQMSFIASRAFEPNSLDFVYIDANHTMPWIMEDIREWSKKVKPGGIVSGHDYADEHDHVISAVDSYALEHGIKPHFVVGVTLSGDYPECIPSWFWVQP